MNVWRVQEVANIANCNECMKSAEVANMDKYNECMESAGGDKQ